MAQLFRPGSGAALLLYMSPSPGFIQQQQIHGHRPLLSRRLPHGPWSLLLGLTGRRPETSTDNGSALQC